jgi:hypothetical protein
MNVYLLKTGQLNTISNQFEFYDEEFFSSEKKVLKEINNRIEINKGYDIINDKIGYDKVVNYSCKSVSIDDNETTEIKIRYVVVNKKVN